jgi:hypothetical protein
MMASLGWDKALASVEKKMSEHRQRAKEIADLIKAVEAVMIGFTSDQRLAAIAHLATNWIFEEDAVLEVADFRCDRLIDRIHMAGASHLLAKVGRT